MEIEVLYFAQVREIIGFNCQMWRTLATTVEELREELLHASPQHAEALDFNSPIHCAVNQELADAKTKLTPGCVVAFFGPITGG